MKQSAVEWLVNEIPSIDWENSYWRNRFYQAKEMEKQQIMESYKDSTSQFSVDARIDYPKSSEQYYNEQFKNK
jgi:hypothetical protein